MVSKTDFRKEFLKQLVVLVTAAFAFTAAFFWNSAIKNTITRFVPAATSWYWELIVAVIVTVIAVVATYFLSKAAASQDKK